MKAETCSCYVLLINYILCNKVVLDHKSIYFINQYNKTKVMHFLLNLLRINYLLILRRSYTNGTWYIACVLCQLTAPGLEWNWEHVEALNS
jgi:hypothetical protein